MNSPKRLTIKYRMLKLMMRIYVIIIQGKIYLCDSLKLGGKCDEEKIICRLVSVMYDS